MGKGVTRVRPGDRTSGEKDKEAEHRTPGQLAKRNGPVGDNVRDDTQVQAAQGAQQGGKMSGQQYSVAA